MTKVLSVEDAASQVADGSTVLLTGSGGGVMDADYVYGAIERRFLQEGHPRDLTLVHATGIGDRGEQGIVALPMRG